MNDVSFAFLRRDVHGSGVCIRLAQSKLMLVEARGCHSLLLSPFAPRYNGPRIRRVASFWTLAVRGLQGLLAQAKRRLELGEIVRRSRQHEG